jgi:hypothetical protein
MRRSISAKVCSRVALLCGRVGSPAMAMAVPSPDSGEVADALEAGTWATEPLRSSAALARWAVVAAGAAFGSTGPATAVPTTGSGPRAGLARCAGRTAVSTMPAITKSAPLLPESPLAVAEAGPPAR